MKGFLNTARALLLSQGKARQFFCLLIGIGLFSSSAQAYVFNSDTTMTLRWTFTSAGANCGGQAAKVAEIYTLASWSTPPPVPSYYCCDEQYDPNSCVQYGGTKNGMPDHSACASATPVPPSADLRITTWKAPGASAQYQPDLSYYNGSSTGYNVYIQSGTNLSDIRVLTGFAKVNGDGCGNGVSMCYRNSYISVAFDPSAAKCDQWVETTTNYNYCAFTEAKVWVKFAPTGGCPSPTPTPPGSTTGGGTSTAGTATGGSTAGSSTAGSTTGSTASTTTTGGSTTSPPPTPTPHINCPSGSTDDSANYNNCFCTVKGQVFTWDGATSGSCACPSGYEVVVVDQATSRAECRPTVKPEFFRNSTTISDNYPVCGAKRAPTDSAYVVPKSASSTVPNSSDVIAGPQGYPYLYATGSGTAPVYNYKNYDHCACTWQDFPLSPTKYTGTANSTVVNGKPRFYPDYLSVISTQDDTASANYGAVPIAKSESVDGRLGVVYSTGYSQCGCPNVNEEMVPIDSTDPYASGVICRPAVTGPYRKLMNYDPLVHDPDPSRTQVINRSSEVIHASGHVIGKVQLRKSATDWTPQLYQRKIWACEYPFTVDVASKECKFDPAKNACNEGNGSEIVPSEVSQNVSGSSKSDQFLNAVNKKLACCLNSFGAVGSSVKFDCVENKISSYSDFDALWSSADSSAQGGQLNAMVLTNPQGKWLSGFYTLDGSRCEEFSEFAGTIQPGVVNPLDGVAAQMNRAQGKLDPNAFQPKGSAIPLPGSGAGGGSGSYSYMLGKMIGLNKTVPSSASERRRCPILVRAAMVVDCPATGGSPLATYNGQCAAAKEIYVHIRAEQVWEIAGQPKMKTVDTVVDDKRMNAGDISIDRIISNKYGNACPPGQTPSPSGGGCQY